MTREDYGKCGAEGTGVVIGQIDHDMIFINVFFLFCYDDETCDI